MHDSASQCIIIHVLSFGFFFYFRLIAISSCLLRSFALSPLTFFLFISETTLNKIICGIKGVCFFVHKLVPSHFFRVFNFFCTLENTLKIFSFFILRSSLDYGFFCEIMSDFENGKITLNSSIFANYSLPGHCSHLID